MNLVHGGLQLVFYVLAIIAFALEAWALIDATRRPADAFPAANKQTKKLWLIILGVAVFFGLLAVVGQVTTLGIFAIAAFVAAVIYLADVRPAVKEYGSGDGRRMGPYGPW
ncbi:uncharacterized protein DUF2516 [Actinocorallia herbida]|uniref:Uncharacterized protein DUF2516 n=1 Tax=Actinocorallia herbida TaxID=58109 RepID=A0A3N1DCH9_9ACTN|nr:DUF2516 family protein [Actinocorallia herbida]ROO91209.1 uncharacterized protein DUF2516 [Actinocorallia herbida]